MSDELVPYEAPDGRSYDQQMRDALEKALTIQGTVIADLESAINCIIQMERALHLVGASQFNPAEATAAYLKTKYRMTRARAEKEEGEARKLLEQGDSGLPEGETLELVEGEIVDD